MHMWYTIQKRGILFFEVRKILMVQILMLFYISMGFPLVGQALRIPNNTNYPCLAGQKIGVTLVTIEWNAPAVRGREGKIWGTDIANFGTKILGFGSDVASPWRAGADECTKFTVSTDVRIEGKLLPAGKYALFVELQPDSSTLIFNKNSSAWGSYFYDKSADVLRVKVKQEKGLQPSIERLNYNLKRNENNSLEVALEWEHWRIPFHIEVDMKTTILDYIQEEMTGELAFDPPSLQTAANWCLANNVNTDQALAWIESATNPFLGGAQSFSALLIQSQLLRKKGNTTKADSIFNTAREKATAMELHQYGRRLLNENKIEEAFEVFQQNFDKNKGEWPTHVGMMRAYSAKGNYKKALEHARQALIQAPDDVNKVNLENSIKILEQDKPI